MFAGIISRDQKPIGYDGHGAPLYEWQTSSTIETASTSASTLARPDPSIE